MLSIDSLQIAHLRATFYLQEAYIHPSPHPIAFDDATNVQIYIYIYVWFLEDILWGFLILYL